MRDERSIRRPSIVVIALIALLATPLSAGESALRIGRIIIDNLDVYSEEEAQQGTFYRLAGSLHVETRPSVIRRYLLFAEGEPYRPERLEETERNLRALSFLKSATVTATEPRNGFVDIIVTTQDAWSLAPETQANSRGGESTFGASLTDTNLFGYGKEASLSWDKMLNRTRYGIDYQDPNLGNYWNTHVSYGSNSDGHDQRVQIRRPFYSFAAPWAAEFSYKSYQQHDRLYQGGLELTRFDHAHRNLLLSYGRALGPNDRTANRLIGGVRLQRDFFDHLETAAGEHLPHSRDYRYVFARWDHSENDFLKLNFVNRDLRFEDFNLGAQWSLEGAVSPRALGALSNSGAVRVAASVGRRIGGRSFLLPAITLQSRLDGGMQNGIASTSIHYVRRGSGERPSTFVARAALQSGWRLDNEIQFFADGDTGLRGYRVHSFAGTRAIVLNAEQRFHLGRELLQIYSPGFALFVDAGNATRGGLGDLMQLKADVGIGIRLGLPRTPRNIIRVDLAYPLHRDPRGRQGLLVSFSSGQAF
jgi:hypothetical protein